MKIWGTLYAKIFGWFWLTLIAGGVLFAVVTLFSGTQPLGRRWMRVTQDLYAHSAIDFYETGGPEQLSRYLATLRNSSGIEAQLLDEHQQDVLGRPLLPHVNRVLQESMKRRASALRLGRIWSTATPVARGGHTFYFVMQVRPLGGFVDGTFFWPLLRRLVLAVLVAAFFCFLLSRHIVTPVRSIQQGALRLAAGDLRTRVLPSIAPRSDELADTARAFDQMADRMQVLIHKRQELLADISHELRSPLTRMSVSLELMRRGETDVLSQVENDIERMNQMIGKILLLTRLDVQPDAIQREPVDLVALLRQIAQQAEFEAQQERKIVRLTGSSSCTVSGDPALLWSGMENVIRNAIRYTAPATAVDIQVQAPPGSRHCTVVITDHGPGVPQEALSSLCEPFYRVSQAREHGSGSGLGLAISRRIIALHGGAISIRNRSEASGLVVSLQLPTA